MLSVVQRRFLSRLQESELVMVAWEEDGVRRCQLGNAGHASFGELAVVVDRAVPMSVPVNVSGVEGEIAGIVKHARKLDSEWLLRVEYQGSFDRFDVYCPPPVVIGSDATHAPTPFHRKLTLQLVFFT